MSDVKLSILLDAKQKTDAAFAAVNKNFSVLTQGAGLLKGALAGAFAGISAGAVLAGINSVTDAASNMRETVSKANTLFGGAQGAVLQEWADGAAVSMGLAKQAALDAVGSMGNMFLQLGAGGTQAADLSTKMVDLSADIASFHNVAGGANEVLGTMQAAFRGEYDALQRYIPTINAAAVEHQALADTGKKSKDELTNLEKAMAAYAIIVQDAGAATGDFERTSDGLANQQRILSANLADVSAELGEGLLPAITEVNKAFNELLSDEGLRASMKGFGELVNEWLVSPVVDMVKVFAAASQVPGGGLAAQIDEVTQKIKEQKALIDKDRGYAAGGGAWGVGTEVYQRQLEEHLGTLEVLEQKLAYLKGQQAAAGATRINPFGSYTPSPVQGMPEETAKQLDRVDKALASWFADLDNKFGYDTVGAFLDYEFIDIDRLEASLRKADALLADFFDDIDKAQQGARTVNVDNALTWEFEEYDAQWAAMIEKTKASQEQMKALSQHTAEAMQDAYATFFFDAMTGRLKSLEDYATAALEAIARALSNVMAQMVQVGVQSGIGALFSSGPTATSTPLPESQLGIEFHGGGVAGAGGGRARSLPAGAWAGAPRLHGGLAADEYAAILRRNESVFTPEQTRALGARMGAAPVTLDVQVKLYNEGGERLALDRQQTSVDGERVVVEAWMSAYNANRFGLRTAMGR